MALLETPTPNVYFYKNTGDAEFQFQGDSPLIDAHAVVLNDYNDYNMDGMTDICYSQCYLTGCDDSIYISFCNQNWSFDSGKSYYIGELNWFRLKSIDLNGDSYPDLFMTGYNSNNKVKILWNNGYGTFSYTNPVGIIHIQDKPQCSITTSPNPFYDRINISVQTTKPCLLSLVICDIYGREVKVFVPGKHQPTGIFQWIWDGKDEAGNECSAGMYFSSLK